MRLTLEELFAAPDFHLFSLEREVAIFLRMDLAAYRRSIFLDGRISPANPQTLQVPLAPLLQRAVAPVVAPQRTAWIFHVAQCGSTLLARALDRGAGLMLREPLPLRQLGVEGCSGLDVAWRLRLRLVAAMIQRRYDSRYPSMVKANVPVNFVLDEVAALDPAAPALFLYFPVESYLHAVLRTPGHRQWVRRVTGELANALAGEAGDVAGLEDGECAAALWLAQMRAFDKALDGMPNGRSLDAELLFSQPRRVISAAAALFEQPMNEAELESVLVSDLFATYSKNPAIRFDNDRRKTRQMEAARMLAPEVARARQWLASKLVTRPLPERLARPLIEENPRLL